MARTQVMAVIPSTAWCSPTTHNGHQRDHIHATHRSYLSLPIKITICLQSAMAEVFGIVASGIPLGGLIGTIIKAGTQIIALYNEIQDASDQVAFRLQELQLLSRILENSNCISSDARNLCELCLDELHLVLAELQSQIRRSRGFRRQVASAKVILKKDVMQKLESRLERSIRLLMFANQSHLLSTQNLVLSNQNAMSSTQTLLLDNQDAMLYVLLLLGVGTTF